MTLAAGKECQGNFVNESTSKLNQTGVTCEFDATNNVPTVKSTHMTTFTVTLKTNGSTTNTPVVDDTSSSDGLSAGAIAGIAIGAVVFVIGIVLLIVFLVKRAKAKKLRRNGGGGRMSVL